MPYLNCPGCRLTVYVPPTEDSLELCPRCSSALGAVRELFPATRSRRRVPDRPRRSALDTVISARRERSTPPPA
jgi:hypothetical protein